MIKLKNNTMKYFLFCVLCIFACAANSQSYDKAKMDQFFDEIERNNRGMGSLSIYQDGQEVYQRAIGFENVEKQIEATSDTRYRIGSISKTYTAAIIMQLVEEGKLELSSTLSVYYPQFENADKITIEHLLQHRSGLFNFTNDEAYPTWMEDKQSNDALIEKMGANENTFEPGTRMEYSNTGYVLLAFIAEKIDGVPFDRVFDKRITKRYGLSDTYYGGKIGARADEAHSYRLGENWKLDTETDMSVPSGAGAIVSTPSDINIFFIKLFNGEVISQVNVNKMKTMVDNYGYGLFEFPFGTKKAVGHNGGIDGFQSSAGYFAEDRMSICYISNGVDLAINEVLIGALNIYFGEDYDIPDLKKKVISDTLLDSYAGVYSDASFPMKITIAKSAGSITAQATGQGAFPLVAEGDHQFKFDQAGIKMVFEPSNGSMTFSQGPGSWTLKKE